jgi:HlyD family secretion protein
LRRRWSRGLVAIALLAMLGYVAHGWSGAGRSFERTRIRIARVERGTLIRDIVADGRVVAASSPTLKVGDQIVVTATDVFNNAPSVRIAN